MMSMCAFVVDIVVLYVSAAHLLARVDVMVMSCPDLQ